MKKTSQRDRAKRGTWQQNLSKRLPTPAKGMGRVQRACRRALIAYDGVVDTSTCITWSYSRRLLTENAKRGDSLNYAVRRALETLGAKRIERTEGRGRPWLWMTPT
jgi:hypothetical protein